MTTPESASITTTDAKTEKPEEAAAKAGADATTAPEEANESQIPGDPRPVGEMQPPTKEEF